MNRPLRKRARARASLAPLVLIAIATLAGCGSSDTPAGLSTYDGSGNGKGGNMSELKGTFVNDDGCVHIEDMDGVSWIPLFPHGKATDRGSKITYGPLSLNFGAEVSVPGAEITQEPDGAQIAPACSEDSRLWLLPVM